MMLDERKAAILRAVVEEYIETAQPVGSGHVVRTAGVAVSSATVRNEMAVLEREGYLVQPHTSAGRIPTDKGYRFFVDQLTGPGVLGPTQRQAVQEFFSTAHGELERKLHQTSQLLASVTDYAAVVIGHGREAATVRTAQVVGLAPRLALVVAVLSDGTVEKRTLELADVVDDAQLALASTRVATLTAHRALDELAEVAEATELRPTGEAADAVVLAAVRALSVVDADEPDHVFVGGVARMAGAFDAVEAVRQVLTTLEQQYVVVTLLRDVLARGLSVAIGAEHGVAPLAQCAVVVSPYEVEGHAAGSVGVLGPTRMNYSQALAAVAMVSQRLGRHLSEGEG
ncbi:MAG: heat-inducible transcriptional repressor HrcA [Actinomycetota bacterium]|jgi:heat-inducible transcriptional repressor|nr:heat-inducible transcriptional repressor HrcA [Actinomycetota bacterium]PLS75243.1 MAG: heat-inducible transcription repressor HrcA [Actinomycetota bacterium]